MFEFIQDIGNYAARKVARDDFDWGLISTARVSNGAQPFETAIQHPRYNSGAVVVVEAYDTREAALAGHKRWVANMTSDPLPAKLVDCCNAAVARMARDMGAYMEFPRKEG